MFYFSLRVLFAVCRFIPIHRSSHSRAVGTRFHSIPGEPPSRSSSLALRALLSRPFGNFAILSPVRLIACIVYASPLRSLPDLCCVIYSRYGLSSSIMFSRFPETSRNRSESSRLLYFLPLRFQRFCLGVRPGDTDVLKTRVDNRYSLLFALTLSSSYRAR